MSDQEADELHQKLQKISEIKLGPLIKCVWGLVIGAFVIGGWVAKLEVQSVHGHGLEPGEQGYSGLAIEPRQAVNAHGGHAEQS